MQTRLGVALGLLIVALSVLLALGLGEAAERRLVRVGSANLVSQAEQVARELSRGMDQFGRDALNQTSRDRYRDPDASPDAMRAALEEFQRENPEFSFASILDAETGAVLAATGGLLERGSLAERPVFREGRKGLYLGDVHGAVRLAELMPRPADGEPLRFLDVAAPVRDASGRVTRVFASHIGWQWTERVRDNLLGPVADRQGVALFLVDTAGKVVLSASPTVPVGTDFSSLVSAPASAASRKTWNDGQDYLTAVASTRPWGRFGGFGWKVLARQPYRVTVASVRDLQLGFLAGGLVIGLVAAVLAWWLTGRLVRPLSRLADQAERLEAGEAWGHSVSPGSGSVDIGEVAVVKRALSRLARSARLSADVSRDSLRQFETLAASLPQVVWQAGPDGRVEYPNHGWIRAAHPGDAFFVADLRARMPADERAEFVDRWQQALAQGRDLTCKLRLQVTDDTPPRWFELQARAIAGPDGRPRRWIGTLFDIDDITSLAEATRRALEEEQSARLQADRAARIRDEFLATVSHELRSPLNAITGWSDILARKRTDDPMIAKASQSIRRNARHQAELIDDLMDMTSVMAGKMVIRQEAVDLAECARSTFLSHLHAAQEKCVELVCREAAPVIVQGEARRLEQVLSNLVGNAVKFTDAGGRVEIAAGAEGALASVRVQDSGRGIGADFLPHVFERMRQEDGSKTRRAGGLGLGLAIARGIVELHGGGLHAASAGAGKGATFTVTLPLAEADERQAVDAPHADGDSTATGTELQDLRVLLVDDEEDAREVAQVALAGFGASVRAVSSAAEGLQVLSNERFDLLVSDIGMPQMDGLSFIRQLRDREPSGIPRMPAVALSAFAMETDIRAGLEAGFQGYVAKPISLHKLHKALVTAIGR